MKFEELKEEINEISIIVYKTDSIITVTKESCLNNDYLNQEVVLSLAINNLAEIYERLSLLPFYIEENIYKGEI